jgi:hypothetical protein
LGVPCFTLETGIGANFAMAQSFFASQVLGHLLPFGNQELIEKAQFSFFSTKYW